MNTLLSPTAAFLPPEELPHIARQISLDRRASDWELFGARPAIEESTNVDWRIDGVESDGSRVFALPGFAIGKPPRRIDVVVTDDWTRMQRHSHVVISFLLHTLQRWSCTVESFETRYMNVPFGSYILIRNIDPKLGQADIELVSNYETEHEWLSIANLQDIWYSGNIALPEIVDLDQIRLQQQPHEAISIVKISGCNDELYVFKTLLFDLKYLYHEIKMLLNMGEHKNIMPRPKYLVSCKMKFGGKTAICGMILEYYPMGTLSNLLSQTIAHESLPLSHKYSWSLDIVSALQHIQKSSMGYFSGLKPSNVLLQEVSGTVTPLLLDFEQRAGRSPWTPPEVYLIDLIEQVASSRLHSSDIERYTTFMQRFNPDWAPTLRRRPRPYNGNDAISRGPWSTFSEREREKAQVFMLGQLLWCLFEEVGSFSRGLDVESWVECGHDRLFPSFEKTPPAMRACIKKCTMGSPEWHGSHSALTVMDRRLHKRNGLEVGPQLSLALEATLTTVKEWWSQELETAEHFMQAYIRRRDTRVLDTSEGGILGLIDERPTLDEVRSMIVSAQAHS